MTKEELKEIYHLNREAIMWQNELYKIECKSLVRGQVITDMPFSGGVSDPTFEFVAERERYRKIIDGKLAEIQIVRNKIMEYINSIDDSLLRQIMFFRNVSCMNWNQIAMELGGYNTADCIRKTYDRFFEKKEGKQI